MADDTDLDDGEPIDPREEALMDAVADVVDQLAVGIPVDNVQCCLISVARAIAYAGGSSEEDFNELLQGAIDTNADFWREALLEEPTVGHA